MKKFPWIYERSQNYKTKRRFICSFVLVLILPVLCFVTVFIQNNNKIYLEKIIGQAQNSLAAVGLELDRKIESLESITQYYMLDSKLLRDILPNNYRDTAIMEELNAEIATHSILQNVIYYNQESPDTLYTHTGTYNLDYYNKLYVKLEDAEQLEQFLQTPTKGTWLSRDGGLQYVITGKPEECWLFEIDLSELKEILSTGNYMTVLQDMNEEQLYVLEEADRLEDEEECYEVSYESETGRFRLIRYMDEQSLFAELREWQNIFMMTVAGIMLLGGALVLLLTYYNVKPFDNLVSYSREKVTEIPEGIDPMDAFCFAVNFMADKVLKLERKSQYNKLLLMLIYGRECDTEAFKEALQIEGLFRNTACYRVVIVAERDTGKANCIEDGSESVKVEPDKISLYLEGNEEKDCEIHLIETYLKDAVVMIIGTLPNMDEQLDEMFALIARAVQSDLKQDICFFVGADYTELEQVHLSYAQALSLWQSKQEGGEYAVYCKSGSKAVEETDNIEKDHHDEADNQCGQTEDVIIQEISAKEILPDISSNDEFIERVYAFIDANVTSCDLNVSLVADYIGVSISHLSHKFKRNTGTTISEYITEKKFVYACELLMTTELSINEISVMIGYTSAVTFIYRFRQKYGTTPAEYRAQNRQDTIP